MIIDHKEAARRAMCHPDTLRKMMAEGEAPGTKVGRRWIVSEEVFQQWIDSRCRSTDAQIHRTGGSGLAARLASQLVRRIEVKPKSTKKSSDSGFGESRNSETVVQFPGKRRRIDG